ncbi:sortase [Arthrobacter sp. NPDC090010]|uniref:sortase n=1 Tax=Arthrobacter sp. NPDC090010 TaxID=3363942 RepID=UPI003828AD9A
MTATVEAAAPENVPPPTPSLFEAPRPKAAPAPRRWELDFSLMLQLVAIVILGFLIQLVFVSRVQHAAAQQQLTTELRLKLAEGSVPVGPSDSDGALIPLGTPIAYLEIPRLDLKEVMVEGTTSSQTAQAVGHQRDTAFPGQPGNAVVMGRNGAYGGVFGGLSRLQLGDRFVVSTGQGRFTYEVSGIRNPGDPEPGAMKPSEGRMTLATAGGLPFLPDDVLRVDAKLVSTAGAKALDAIRVGSITDAEKPLGSDTSGLVGLVFLLQLAIAAGVACVWSWKKWGRWQSWMIFIPAFLTLGLLIATPLGMLLPNLL